MGQEQTILELVCSSEAMELLGERETGFVDSRLLKSKPETVRKDLVSFSKFVKFLVVENDKNNLVDKNKLQNSTEMVKNIARSLKKDQKRLV